MDSANVKQYHLRKMQEICTPFSKPQGVDYKFGFTAIITAHSDLLVFYKKQKLYHVDISYDLPNRGRTMNNQVMIRRVNDNLFILVARNDKTIERMR